MNKKYVFNIFNKLYLSILTVSIFITLIYFIASPIGFWNDYQKNRAEKCFIEEIKKKNEFSTNGKPWEKYKNNNYNFSAFDSIDYSSDEFSKERELCNITRSGSYNSELSVYETNWTFFSANSETYQTFFFFLIFTVSLMLFKKWLVWIFQE